MSISSAPHRSRSSLSLISRRAALRGALVVCTALSASFSASLITPLNALAQTSQPPVEAHEKRELVIFHTSDIHGYVKPHEARWHNDNPKRMIE
mgnify:CR=1 FL=1